MKKGHSIHMDCTTYVQFYMVSEDGIGGTCSLCCILSTLGVKNRRKRYVNLIIIIYFK